MRNRRVEKGDCENVVADIGILEDERAGDLHGLSII